MRSSVRGYAAVSALVIAAVVISPQAAVAGTSGLSVAQCLTSSQNAVTGCTQLTGVAGNLFVRDQAIAITPSASTLYLASNAGVSWYSLDATGSMTYQGCLDCSSTPTDRPPVTAASSLAVSPDGSALYVGAHSTLDRFSIGADGTPTFTSCIDFGGDGGNCTDGPNVGYDGDSMLVSSDSSSVFLADGFSRVTVGAAGALSVSACLVAAATTGCTVVPADESDVIGVERMAMAPDGSVYGTGSGYLTHFSTTGNMAIDSCATVSPEATTPDRAGCATQLTAAEVGEFVDGSIDVAADGSHLLVSDDDELVNFDIGSSSPPAFDSCYGLTGVTPAACTGLPQPLDGDFGHSALIQSGSTLYAGNSDGVDTLTVTSALTPSTTGCLTFASSSTPPCDLADPPDAVVTGTVMVMSPTLGRIYVPADNDDDSGLTELTIAGSSTSPPPSPAPTTTRLSESPSPATVGKPVTLIATVSAAGLSPSGTVDFTAGTVPLCSGAPVSSTAPHVTNCVHTFTKAATESLTAAYSGSTDFDASSATGTLTVTGPGTVAKRATKTVVTAHQHHTAKRTVLHLKATVRTASGTFVPTGSVRFSRGSKHIKGCGAKKLSKGKAKCSITVAHGHVKITARYLGTTQFAASSAKRKVAVT